MALFTASQGGIWNSAATWGGAGIPGNGDTVNLNGFAISINDARIIGTSPNDSTTAAITQNTNGQLIINGSGVLTLRGNYNLGTATNATISFGLATPGGGIIFDSSLSASPSTTRYTINTGPTPNITYTGSATQRSFLKTQAGCAAGFFTQVLAGGAVFNASFTDFDTVGDTTNDFFTVDGSTISTNNVTMNNCGLLNVTQATNVSILGLTETNSNARIDVALTGHVNPLKLKALTTATTKIMDSCYFDFPPDLCGNGMVYSNLVFKGCFDAAVPSTTTWNIMKNCIINNGVPYAINAPTPNGPMQDIYFTAGNFAAATYSGNPTAVGTNTLTDNTQTWPVNGLLSVPWFVEITAGPGAPQVREIVSNTATQLTTDYAFTPPITTASSYAVKSGTPHLHWVGVIAGASFNRIVCQHLQSHGTDVINLLFSTSNTTGTNILVIPCSSTVDQSGNWPDTASGGSGNVLEHCTYRTGTYGMIQMESVSTGTFSSFRANIAYCPFNPNPVSSSFGPYFMYYVPDTTGGSGPSDPVTAGKCNWNGRLHLKQPSAAPVPGYCNVTSVNPGQNDVIGDPLFYDTTRNLEKWALSRGSQSTTIPAQQTDAFNMLKANPGLVFSSLLPYVRKGHAPRNSTHRNSAFDGNQMGAVAYMPFTSRRHYFRRGLARGA